MRSQIQKKYSFFFFRKRARPVLHHPILMTNLKRRSPKLMSQTTIKRKKMLSPTRKNPRRKKEKVAVQNLGNRKLKVRIPTTKKTNLRRKRKKKKAKKEVLNRSREIPMTMISHRKRRT